MAKKFNRGDVSFESVHGCDGCCFEGKNDEVENG
jgi:hypothetical protein